MWMLYTIGHQYMSLPHTFAINLEARDCLCCPFTGTKNLKPGPA